MNRPRIVSTTLAILIVAGSITFVAVDFPWEHLENSDIGLPEPPPWAKVAPEQVAAARKHRVPVAFENGIGMRFVLIPAGTFQMGSRADEQDREEYETLHGVTISHPFYLSITEVTNAQYRRWRPSHDSGRYDDYDLNGEDQPVLPVPWEDAAAFATWLGRQDPTREYRLPTEAEWEYACRAGTQTAFTFGDRVEDLVRFANFSDRNDPTGALRPDLDDGYAVTAPVGSYAPNAWGLYDVHGNVWEWCSDWYGPYPKGHATDPVGPASGDVKVRRGGAWRWFPRFARAAYRRYYTHEAHLREDGFRVVVPLPADRDE